MQSDVLDISQTEEIYSVSRLAREVKFILEGNFPLIWVEGEISNFSTPNSGHWYFSVKDNNAQIRCAMFRMNNRNVCFQPKDGSHVLVKARVSLYEGRGDFQLIVEQMEEIGEGKLRQAFDALKQKLLAAGLFDPKHKKPLPSMPKSIGVITSATGAAIRDILSVLRRRFCCVPIIIYPSLVQGETAAFNIAQAIKLANTRKECDVIILARGGGSLEDLWPFNEEIVANAIFESELPIVSGVGHEVDFTISDFVADIRAATPSAAAELVVPSCDELLQNISLSQNRLLRCLQQTISQLKQQVIWTNQHLQQQHPKKHFAEQAQRLDLAEAALINLQQKLLTQRQNALANLAGKLDALSPLATLQRGFSIVKLKNKVIIDSKDIKVKDKLKIRLANGNLECVVEKIEN